VADNQGARIAVLEEKVETLSEAMIQNAKAHKLITDDLHLLNTTVAKIIISAKTAWVIVSTAIVLGPALGVVIAKMIK